MKRCVALRAGMFPCDSCVKVVAIAMTWNKSRAELLRQGTDILKVADLRATESGTGYLRDTQPLCRSPRLLPGAAQYPAESASPGPPIPRGQPQSHS